MKVVEGVDRDADLANFGTRDFVVRGVAALGGQIEGDREPVLAPRQVRAVQLVGGVRAGVSGIGAKDPRPIAGQLAVFGPQSMPVCCDLRSRRHVALLLLIPSCAPDAAPRHRSAGYSRDRRRDEDLKPTFLESLFEHFE